MLAERVTRFEDRAGRLGAVAIDDPARPAEHVRFQNDGDRLRGALQAASAGERRELSVRRLEAAELVADRMVIEAVSGYTVQVDRLAIAALAGLPPREETVAKVASLYSAALQLPAVSRTSCRRFRRNGSTATG